MQDIEDEPLFAERVGDAGVIEDQQAFYFMTRSQPGDMAGQLTRRYRREMPVGVIEQGNRDDPELGGGLAEFPGTRPA